MNGVLVDSNVLIDVLDPASEWHDWSRARLHEAAEARVLVVNPIIYAEVAVGFIRPEDVDDAIPPEVFRREALPWLAGFLAGKAFARYRRAGGQRRSPLPDFYIGAHAAVRRHTLLTRDGRTYREYFPGLDVIAP